MSSGAPTHGSERPIYFMIGAQRSGSTLLRLMLDHHPQIACLHEFNFALEALNADGSEPDRATLRRRLEADRQFRYSGLRLNPDLDYAAAVKDLFEQLRLSRGSEKPIAGVTLHFHYQEALRYWPEARFIHLVRDPRDVSPSVIAMGWAGTAWHATRLWVEAEQEVAELVAVIPAHRITRLRFEDLVCRPEEELSRLCQLLGVSYSPRMLDYPAHSTYPPPDASAAGRWKGRMPEADVRQVEARAGERMRALGYELSGLPPLHLSAVQRSGLSLRDKAYRVRWRMRTYGAATVMTRVIASRIGWKSMAERANRRMQDIQQQRLR